MRKRILLIPVYFLFCTVASSQIIDGLDTLYGYEWISNENPHLKLTLTEDNFYRIDYQSLVDQGWPVASINSEDYRLFHAGEAVPYYSTAAVGTPLGSGDFLVFYGQGNRGELDQHLYRNPEQQQLNPEYSLFSDKATYYLSWQSGGGALRYNTLPNDLTNLPSAEPYVWQRAQEVFSNSFMKEYYRFSGTTLYYSHFGIGEGYGSRSINELLADGSTIQTVNLALPAAYINGPDPILKTRYTAALFEHIQQLKADGNLIRTDNFYDWKMLNVTTNLPTTVLADQELNLEWEGLGGEKDEVSIGFVQLDYPATPNAANTSTYACRIEATGGRQYLEVANFDGTAAIVYDLANAYRIVVNTISGGLLQVALPAATQPRKLRIIALESSLPIPAVSAANLQIPELGDASYLILTHSLLRAGGDDPVQAYANFRASTIGGGYQTAVVNIDDLFDQFGYGVQQHPMAIRNFIAWQRKVNPSFRYLFIIGKGREYIDLRTPANLTAALGTTLFVPSFGYPASDNLLASRIDKPTPLVSLGRLPAINPQEVRLYLNKIQGMETFVASSPQTIEGRSWMKNALHLGGGSSPSEQQSIKNNLANMGREFEQGVFGGEVTSFYKTSADPIQTSLTDQIFSRINKGVSILTFFGHSSAGTFDFNIDNPDNYNNTNKYPLMLSLGCYSGNMFDSFRSIGERFIFLENGGAGAFGASRGLGFIHALSNFGRYFYERTSTDLYGFPIGDAIRQTIGNYENFTDQAYGTLNEQFSLQGDPALRLHPAPGPDYTFDSEKTKFTPSIINAQKDSFSVSIQLHNLGQFLEDTLELTIGRKYPDGTQVNDLLRLRVPAPAYVDEVEIILSTGGKDGVGANTLFVTANTAVVNPLPESPLPSATGNNQLTQSNGETGVPFFIVDNTALPVWPPNYALVGDAALTLKASTADALAPERKYFMQLDTTPHFNQPLANTSIVQRGGVINWTPTFSWQDSVVYYWRVTPDSLDIGTSGYVWEQSSFTYISGIPGGWGQGHWGQYVENSLENIEVATNEQLDFVVDLRDLTIRNVIYDVGNISNTRPEGFVDGNKWTDFFRWNIRPSLQIVVIDTLGDFLRNANPGLYGSVNTSTPNAIACFSFPVQTVGQRENIINFLEEIIPDNYTIIIYNAIRSESQDLWINEWAADSLTLAGKNIFNVLESNGAQQVRDLLGGPMRPYFFAYEKGGAVLDEKIAQTAGELLFYSIDLPGRWTNGQMTSKQIGPAQSWDRLVWNTPLESENDTVRIQLRGMMADGSLEMIMDSVALSGELDLSNISASTFPKLLLNFYGEDRYEKTCPPLNYWHLYYQGLPDLAIDGNLVYEFSADTLHQGEEMILSVGVSNISDQDIGATRAQFRLQGQGQQTEEWELDLPPLSSGENFTLTTNRTTATWNGPTQLSLNINPSDSPTERLRINNQAVKDFMILGDEIVPVVDVTFDGQQILDGDLVSASPLIQISIADENRYLLLADTSLFVVVVRDPSGNEETLSLSSTEVQFFPATNPTDNVARLEWEPRFVQDGEYKLMIRGKDQSGNQAHLWYETHFEIITRQMLSNVLPYPNPFSTSTRFVYTLTGDEAPDQYKIQIMTISGRIVREINQHELGPLQVGTHLTDFVWDGTDTYGDQLATGTYLYRVIALDAEGKQLERYNNGTEAFFLNQIGKIVILR